MITKQISTEYNFTCEENKVRQWARESVALRVESSLSALGW